MPPPPKRKRTDSMADDPKPSQRSTERYERSRLIYFDDGNIVLVAEKIAFRVHKGQLAHHFEIFRGMFATVAQPGDAEAFDGCPVVKMAGDTSVDLEALLRTLYFFDPVSLKSSLSQLEGVLRLSEKYILDVPRKHVFDTLSFVYPDTLTKWNARPRHIRKPMSIIALARTAGANILLPAAFYELCSSPRKFMDLHHSELGTEGLRVYYHGRDALWEFWAAFILEEKNMGKECEHPDCDTEWNGFIQTQQCRLIIEIRFHFLTPLEELKGYEVLLTQWDLCFQAQMAAQARCRKKRQELWNCLPTVFGLGSWEALKNDA